MTYFTAFTSAAALSLLSAVATASVIYVSGIKYTLNKSDFQQSGQTFTAALEVVGDQGRPLMFDIDARVGGLGKETPEASCAMSCHTAQANSNTVDFRYVVEMQVSCSGIAIGSETDNRNALNDTWVSDRYREVKLLVDNTLTTHGQCQQLDIAVKGLDLDHISMIDLDVIIAEYF